MKYTAVKQQNQELEKVTERNGKNSKTETEICGRETGSAAS